MILAKKLIFCEFHTIFDEIMKFGVIFGIFKK
jgi:hypothetical protein